jgi:hypothetical protein
MGRAVYRELCKLALGGLWIAGCAEETPRTDCPARAAFELVVRAPNGPLPRQTTITVGHSGGMEQYRLDAQEKREVVLCEELRADAGDDAGGAGDVLSVYCELWTRSLTTVEVKAPGYAPLERQLPLETQESCIHTQSIELLLDPGDGSPSDD